MSGLEASFDRYKGDCMLGFHCCLARARFTGTMRNFINDTFTFLIIDNFKRLVDIFAHIAHFWSLYVVRLVVIASPHGNFNIT